MASGGHGEIFLYPDLGSNMENITVQECITAIKERLASGLPLQTIAHRYPQVCRIVIGHRFIVNRHFLRNLNRRIDGKIV